MKTSSARQKDDYGMVRAGLSSNDFTNDYKSILDGLDTTLGDYVLKETGKGLSSNDLPTTTSPSLTDSTQLSATMSSKRQARACLLTTLPTTTSPSLTDSTQLSATMSSKRQARACLLTTLPTTTSPSWQGLTMERRRMSRVIIMLMTRPMIGILKTKLQRSVSWRTTSNSSNRATWPRKSPQRQIW